jgi:hypothetical protein
MAPTNQDATESSKKVEAEKNGDQASVPITKKESHPHHHNSEPSSQPTHNHKASSTAPDAKREPSRHHQPPQVAGMSAATVAAMLGPPTLDELEKRTWRQRWSECKSKFTKKPGHYDRLRKADRGSAPHLNVFGSRVDGRVTMQRSYKK